MAPSISSTSSSRARAGRRGGATGVGALLTLVGLVVVGCGAQPPVSPTPTAGPSATPSSGTPAAPTSGTPAAPTSGVPRGLVQVVIARAAQLSGRDESTFEVVRAESVSWSNGALGCPIAGQAYGTEPRDGHWVVVRSGPQEFDFRLALDGEIRLCPPGHGQSPPA